MLPYLVKRHFQMGVRKKIYDANVVKWEEIKEKTRKNHETTPQCWEVAHWQTQLTDTQNLEGQKSNSMADFVIIPWAAQCTN